jgi:hypothetical protein
MLGVESVADEPDRLAAEVEAIELVEPGQLDGRDAGEGARRE